MRRFAYCHLVWAFTLAIAIGFSVEVHALDFWIWDRGPNYPEVLIPREDTSRDPRDALRAYIRATLRNKELASLPQDPANLSAEAGTLRPLPKSPSGQLVRFAVFANQFTDLEPLQTPLRQGSQSRIGRIAGKLAPYGGQVVVVPVAADIALSLPARVQYWSRLDAGFDALMPLGGQDWDPARYRRKQTHARNINPTRDRSELGALTWSIRHGKAAVFGICRGHQACAIASGSELIQDIEKEVKGGGDHAGTWHEISIRKGSFLDRLLGTPSIRVNSLHHQAVKSYPTGALVTSATSQGNGAPVIEAAEFADGRGFTLQFHPELMEDEAGTRIMAEMVGATRRWRRSHRGGCAGSYARLAE